MMSTARSAVPLIMAILLVTVGGCSTLDELGQNAKANATGAPPPPKIKPQRSTPPAPRPKPAAGAPSKPEDVVNLDTSSPEFLSEIPEFDPRSLIGLKPAQALASLGNPASVVERSPSMVWRYNVKGCALDLFFYMDLGDNAFRVLAYEMKAGASTDAAARTCLGHLRAAADGK